MHYTLYMLNLFIFMYSFAASSSSETSSTDKPLSRKILEQYIVEDQYEDDLNYPRTIRMLRERNYATENITLPFPEWHVAASGGQAQYTYVDISPLQCTLNLQYYSATVAIAKAFPQRINSIDKAGNTLLHNIFSGKSCNCEDCIPREEFVKIRELVKLLRHQINTPNQQNVTPIFLLDQPQFLPIFVLMGADLDVASIKTMRPPHWRNENMLGTLHYLGFGSDFLATTFDVTKAKIKETSKLLAPALAAIIQKELQVQCGASMYHMLQVREHVGRSTHQELRRQAIFKQTCKSARQASRFRINGLLELLDKHKRERRNDESADGTKRQRRM